MSHSVKTKRETIKTKQISESVEIELIGLQQILV
jgi:hypothetical protein